MWRLNETAYIECQTYNRQGKIRNWVYDAEAQTPYIMFDFQRILSSLKKGAMAYWELVCMYVGAWPTWGRECVQSVRLEPDRCQLLTVL